VEVFEGEYGLYRQELDEAGRENSALKKFAPDVVLLAMDAHTVAAEGVDAALENMAACWRMAQQNLGATVVQQTVLPVLPALAGNNEQRLAGSGAAVIARVNERMRAEADAAGVHLLAVDAAAAQDGVALWFEAALWHRAKQEVHPRVSHLYGEQVGRLLAALRGRSAKCLVLDLDNTLWGGVIGDDGLEGIVLGQGSAVGESYVELQRYAQALSERGVVLAVCSKNDEENALAPFGGHPEMVLKRGDIACFVANWEDKATNLRAIAERLNLGLDAMVFVDDNPFERNLVRTELPMVAVPELPEDPADYVRTIAAGGYFETVSVTDDDRARAAQYQANAEREKLRGSTTDMAGYLRSLEMKLLWDAFDRVGLSRIVQLINKTNQFNLTTKRYAEPEVVKWMEDRDAMTLQMRLTDRFGDNGIIGLIIGKKVGDALEIDTWLMSCRVLGRQVEEATLNLIVEQARKMGARRIRGEYLPTKKNGMVREHYGKLGFRKTGEAAEGGSKWELDVEEYAPHAVHLATVKGAHGHGTGDTAGGSMEPAHQHLP
jgi:FkbH-like protein